MKGDINGFFHWNDHFYAFSNISMKERGSYTYFFLSHGMYSQIILYESLSPRMMRRVITIRLKIREL